MIIILRPVLVFLDKALLSYGWFNYAGYDILSYNENQEKIYIEVKAVSSTNFKFYLSSNEFNKANLMNKNYFLYLLPRDLSNLSKFDYEGILKINEIIFYRIYGIKL